MAPRHYLTLSIVALLFIGAHALTVPTTLEDEDSVNLALGVESFDVRRYAPHPPGYPVYVALGKGTTSVVSAMRPDWSRTQRAAAGLAWLSVIAGGLGVFAFAALWRGLGVPPWWAVGVATATLAAPLYWFTAARPLTDVPGLVAAVAVQAAVLHQLRHGSPSHAARWWAVIGASAGLAIGIRSQTIWLTLPALAVAFVTLMTRRDRAASLALPAGGMVGVLVWFVPLMVLSGGPGEYAAVLRGQGQHDFDAVQMLATQPSWDLLRADLAQTFLHPWQLTGMPLLVLGAALIGLPRLARWSTTAPLWLCALGLPYLAFHLLFHEVETIRYALPTVSLVGGLAAIAPSVLGRYIGAAVLIVALGAGVVVSHPVTAEYAAGSPVFTTLEEMRTAAAAEAEPPRIEAHHRAWWASSRALDWTRREWDVPLPRLIDRDETLRLVDYWRTGAATPIWFLSDPDRGDLVRFDPRATVWQATRRLSTRTAPLIAGLRTYDVGWWRLSRPFWMLGRGWSLTPELDHESGTDSDATVFLLRHDAATVLFVGARADGRHPEGTEIVATVDGQEVDRWRLENNQRTTRWISIPAGVIAGATGYATLTLQPESAGPTQPGRVTFDQFDAVAGSAPLVALGRGWSPPEADSGPSKRAHRTSRLSEIEVRHAGRPVRVTVRGERQADMTPLGSTVVITAGQALLARFVAVAEFEQTFEITPDVLDHTGGVITIAVDLPRGDAPGGLRIRDVLVTDAGNH